MRIGKCTSDDLFCINRTGSLRCSDPETHTILCSKKAQVELCNKKALEKIPGENISFFAKDEIQHGIANDLLKKLYDCAPMKVTIKVGCAVILTRKFQGMLPGTRLIVKSASRSLATDNPGIFFIAVSRARSGCGFRLKPVRFDVLGQDGCVVACRTQFSIVSAYALTVHRTQGLTLETVAMHSDEVGT